MLTHRALCGLCDNFMAKEGWYRAQISGASPMPDRAYFCQESIPLIFEIKPSNIQESELARGIGQLSIMLPYRARLYLCIPEKWALHGKDIWQYLPLGVISYDKELKIFHKAPERPWGELIPISPTKIPIPTAKVVLFLSQLPDEQARRVSLDELTAALQGTYPDFSVPRSWLGAILHKIGFLRVPQDYLSDEEGPVYFKN